MNQSTHRHLIALRINTAYSGLRWVANLIASAGYFFAVVEALSAIGFGIIAMNKAAGLGTAILIGGLFSAAITAIIAKLLKEAALVLADIGDSLLDINSKMEPRIHGAVAPFSIRPRG